MEWLLSLKYFVPFFFFISCFVFKSVYGFPCEMGLDLWLLISSPMSYGTVYRCFYPKGGAWIALKGQLMTSRKSNNDQLLGTWASLNGHSILSCKSLSGLVLYCSKLAFHSMGYITVIARNDWFFYGKNGSFYGFSMSSCHVNPGMPKIEAIIFLGAEKFYLIVPEKSNFWCFLYSGLIIFRKNSVTNKKEDYHFFLAKIFPNSRKWILLRFAKKITPKESKRQECRSLSNKGPWC